ncbi:DUF5361 domain-containing protein [Gordonia sp. DT101]|uniref:DUF5361 domain-containing protein n=1 Tax=Gordonia sp. DT101 TaxID=3416545 RepID=UPI003CEAAA13
MRAVHAASAGSPQDAAEQKQWGLLELLLADIADSQRWLVWSKSKDAARPGAKPPARIPRPGVSDAEDKTRRRGNSYTLDEAKQRFKVARIGGESS